MVPLQVAAHAQAWPAIQAHLGFVATDRPQARRQLSFVQAPEAAAFVVGRVPRTWLNVVRVSAAIPSATAWRAAWSMSDLPMPRRPLSGCTDTCAINTSPSTSSASS
jgi:hypothetical protein